MKWIAGSMPSVNLGTSWKSHVFCLHCPQCLTSIYSVIKRYNANTLFNPYSSWFRKASRYKICILDSIGEEAKLKEKLKMFDIIITWPICVVKIKVMRKSFKHRGEYYELETRTRTWDGTLVLLLLRHISLMEEGHVT